MALLLSGSDTDRINHGSDASLDNIDTGTFICWAYSLFDASTNAELFHKATGTPARSWLVKTSNVHEIQYGRTGTNLQATAALGNFAHYGTSKWCFFAAAWDFSGANGDQILLIGDLDSPAAEPSSYSTQVVGTGSAGDDSAADFIVGNHPSGSVSWDGRIALFAAYAELMTIAQIQALQGRLQPGPQSTCKLFCNYGFHGTGTQTDWSGNENNGTVTGATVADHVPIGITDLGHVAPVPGNPWYYYAQQGLAS